MSGLKVIDGTPTAISEYLREKEEQDKIIEELEIEIEKKKKEFSQNAKQCNFCGNYYGDLSNQINELIAQKEGIKQGIQSQKENEIKFLEKRCKGRMNTESDNYYVQERLNKLKEIR